MSLGADLFDECVVLQWYNICSPLFLFWLFSSYLTSPLRQLNATAVQVLLNAYL